jgi:hypothetical protein
MDVDAEVHMRQRLEKTLRRPIPDEIWRDLKTDGLVDDAVAREGWGDLVRIARQSLSYLDLGARRPTTHRQPTASRRAPVQARARALMALLAREAEVLPAVIGIRTWWGGGRLGRDEAIELAQSPAWRLIYVEQLRRYPRLRIGALGDAHPVRLLQSRILAEGYEEREGHLGSRFEIGLTLGTWRRSVSTWINTAAMKAVTVAVPRGEALQADCSPLSLVGRVTTVANGLVRDMPWTEEDAAWFVLTGDPPPVAPVLYGIERRFGPGYRRAVVKLEVEPWVPQDVVLAAYRQAQAEVLPKANRSIGERTAELARFAASGAGQLSVGAAMRLWNETHPQWLEHDRRNFQRQAKQAMGYISSPLWKPFSVP